MGVLFDADKRREEIMDVSFDADKWQEVFGIFIRMPTNGGKVYRDAFLLPTHVCGVLAFGLVSQICFCAYAKERGALRFTDK